MARPQSDAKLGFFPFSEPCIPLLLRHLLPPHNPAEATILDPCAGKGIAVAGLASGLGVPDNNVYCIELSESRSEEIRGSFPDFEILGPASFAGTQISYNTFSLAYVNPPYSSEMGGGRREELSFLIRSLNHAVANGVVCLVLPETQVFDWGSQAADMRRTLSCRLASAEVYALPSEHRAFGEVVVIGTRRERPLAKGDGPLGDYAPWYEAKEQIGILGEPTTRHRIPSGRRPRRFSKIDFTPEELSKRIARSPLARHLDPPAALFPPSPPLPPGKGHVALILASGNLDGLVCPEGEPPHVVRGTARKVRYKDHSKSESTTAEDGSSSEKEVFSERIELIIRAIDPAGSIRTFTDAPPTAASQEGTPPHVPENE